MNESKENIDWQTESLNADLLNDMRKYEAQYKIIGVTFIFWGVAEPMQRVFQV